MENEEKESSCVNDRKGMSIFRESGYGGGNSTSQEIKVTMRLFGGQSLS